MGLERGIAWGHPWLAGGPRATVPRGLGRAEGEQEPSNPGRVRERTAEMLLVYIRGKKELFLQAPASPGISIPSRQSTARVPHTALTARTA